MMENKINRATMLANYIVGDIAVMGDKTEFHAIDKKSSYLREALYKEYDGKCFYCKHLIEFRHMQVDHILPTNRPELLEDSAKDYIQELESKGFLQDSIENYVPTCSACNRDKGNIIFAVDSIRFYHERARLHVKNIIRKIEKLKNQQVEEFFYEPVDESIWNEMDFSYQRGINYAIMGYRLCEQDVLACPEFSQVGKIEKQLSVVDYALIQGETGCGKSMSLFHLAYRFYNRGWRVYVFKGSDKNNILPDNSDNSLYLVDDAQVYSDSFLSSLQNQARSNKKVVFAKTVGNDINYDTVLLTNSDSVKLITKDFLSRKAEIQPIVSSIDDTVGVNFMQEPIERRIKAASVSLTPWQFAYVLRGGWKQIRELYIAVSNHNNNDLLLAMIAMFQILYLDKPVDLDKLVQTLHEKGFNYAWDINDIEFLVKKYIILSKEDIRIVHLEGAKRIIALFIESGTDEKKNILFDIYETAYLNNKFSPLGIVWLCNGASSCSSLYHDIEKLFVSDKIIDKTIQRIGYGLYGESARDIIAVLNKIFQINTSKALAIVKEKIDVLLDLFNHADAISAWVLSDLLNNLVNNDREMYCAISKEIQWHSVFSVIDMDNKYGLYSWAKLIDRGFSFVPSRVRGKYIKNYDDLIRLLSIRANYNNILEITEFFKKTFFINPTIVFEVMTKLLSIYEGFFKKHTKEVWELVDFEFVGYFCGISYWDNKKPTYEQEVFAKQFVRIIPNMKIAEMLSESNVREWASFDYLINLISKYDFEKYKDIIQAMDLVKLSKNISMSWDQSHEIAIILESIYLADRNMAKKLLEINIDKIPVYSSVLIMVSPEQAVSQAINKSAKLDILTSNWWEENYTALRCLIKVDRKFALNYLKDNVSMVAKKYSDVTALDFTDKYSLGFLKEIKTLDEMIFQEVLSEIDRTKVQKHWDQCAGINPRKKRWVNMRKKEYFELIGLE